jgi:glycosyltransferase involved in cell wall biosynthesis
MACGTPVVTSNMSSMPEVAGDAALTIDPYDVAALRDNLRVLLTNETLRETLITRGFEQSARFQWGKAAAQLKDIYDGMLGS